MFGNQKKAEAKAIMERIQVIFDDISSNADVFDDFPAFTQSERVNLLGFFVYYTAGLKSSGTAKKLIKLYMVSIANTCEPEERLSVHHKIRQSYATARHITSSLLKEGRPMDIIIYAHAESLLVIWNLRQSDNNRQRLANILSNFNRFLCE